MVKIDFLICGRRAFDVLQHFVQEFGQGAVNIIVSYPDKNVKNDPFEELVQYCNQHGLRLVARENYTGSDQEYRYVMGWQWLFVPGQKTIVFHDSLLPEYRGFAPLVNSLINGERKVGVTAFFPNEHYDEGDIISQRSIEVRYPVKIHEMISTTTSLFSNLASEIYKHLSNNGKITAQPQDHAKATYSLWRDELDFHIDWSQPAETILRFIHAVGFPYSGAVCYLNGEKIIIHDALCITDVVIMNRIPGKVIFIHHHQPVVVCKEGLLRITSAEYAVTGKSIFPFTRIRIRFN